MPAFLTSINIKDATNLLREFHIQNEGINQICSFNNLLQSLHKDIQRARYERLILNLAEAYSGYQFYLPAFLDFRGRIYRSGILHFHERDLSRSLIIFANSCPNNENMITDNQTILESAIVASSFHYKSFHFLSEAYYWYINCFIKSCCVKKDAIANFDINRKHNDILLEYEVLHSFVKDAKRPFQFLSNFHFLEIISKNGDYNTNKIPITQDASASAYQIMSYFLLDHQMGYMTNLISNKDGQIKDVYEYLLDEFKVFLDGELDKDFSMIVCKTLTRKIVKSIFMPIIYGKTVMSTASDLKDHLSHYFTKKDCFVVASACFKFWRLKYPGMECLIQLIRNIGWLASASNRAVFYKVPFFRTAQDYMQMENMNIWVYDRLHKKRRRVTLRVSSSKRDRRKSEISTFVNFIHQRDAHIAMSVVKEMLNRGAPIYTVHDNFITTIKYSHLIPKIYSDVFIRMGPPLRIINSFIYLNVFKPIDCNENELYDNENIIPTNMLEIYLKKHIPENLNKNMKATWEKRISGILSSYENYTRQVCGKSSNWNSHEERWLEFKRLVNGDHLKNIQIQNHSVHY